VRLIDRVLSLFEGVAIALEAIRSNKVRAGLTIGGVAIGVFVVVAMAAAVHGVTASFRSDVDALGATSFQVSRRVNIGPTSCDGSDESCPDRRNPAVTSDEAAMIRRLPSIFSVTESAGGNKPFGYRDRELASVGYDAVSETWLETDAGDISPGRNFTPQENAAGRARGDRQRHARRAPVRRERPGGQVGHDRAAAVPRDRRLPRQGRLPQVAERRGPDNPRAVLPIEAARRHLDVWRRGVYLTVKPRDGVSQADAMDDVTAAMRARRGLRPTQPNNFGLVTQDRLTETFDKLFGTLFVIGLTLSAVGLLVGGVGVVAIMMISVTERTREIGVRKALGATRAVILFQFLVEAATLTSIGAGIGLLLGAGAALLIRTTTSIPAAVPTSAVLSALGASALTGVLFGMVPAVRAARLDPVEALRYE
jgi:putative ABC transport system permease protein